MLSGIKEDIVLEEYVPNASFDFILDTDGLFLYTDNEGSYLAASPSSKKVFDLGKVVVYDAVGRPTTGTMKIKTVTEGQQYRLTISAPEEFLTDPLTSYPVTIELVSIFLIIVFEPNIVVLVQLKPENIDF